MTLHVHHAVRAARRERGSLFVVLLIALAIICVVLMMQLLPNYSLGAPESEDQGELRRTNRIQYSLGRARDLKARAEDHDESEQEFYQDPRDDH